jgi:hypothetical protein
LLSVSGLSAKIGQVRLAFYDDRMEPVEAKDLSGDVKLLIGERDSGIKIDFKKSRFKAPFGYYTLVVVAEGFHTYRRPILVSSKTVDLLVALELGSNVDPPPAPQIEGRIVTGNHDLSSLWVRVLPLFGREGVTFDSRVGEDGRFSIDLDWRSTPCVVLVLAPGVGEFGRPTARVVWMQHVNLTTPLQIALD